MKLRYIICLFLSSFLVYSCGDDTKTFHDTDNPFFDSQIYSVSLKGVHTKWGDSTLRAQDSIRFVQFNKTNYSIDQVDGVIYNPDSLPYGMKLGKVFVKLTFNPSYGVSKIGIQHPDSVGFRDWNATDSIDFSNTENKILKIRVFAANQAIESVNNPTKYYKEYKLMMLVRKVDPTVVNWTSMGDLPTSMDNQKVLIAEDEFYSFSTLSGNISLYKTQTSNVSWEQKLISGLPSNIKLESINYMEGRFFAIADNGNSYTSANGESWTQQNNGQNVTSIFGVLPNSSGNLMLVGIKENDSYVYGTTTDFASISIVEKILSTPSDNTIKARFPINSFSSATNYSSNGKSNFLALIGGIDKGSNILNTVWLVEKTVNGIAITSSINPFITGTGMSAYIYDGKLNVFTALYDSDKKVLTENKIYTSEGWGGRWFVAPDKQNPISEMKVRTNQTVLVDDENYMWVFGGVSESVTLNDSWKGRLNKVSTK